MFSTAHKEDFKKLKKQAKILHPAVIDSEELIFRKKFKIAFIMSDEIRISCLLKKLNQKISSDSINSPLNNMQSLDSSAK
jgi:hypothetical protein